MKHKHQRCGERKMDEKIEQPTPVQPTPVAPVKPVEEKAIPVEPIVQPHAPVTPAPPKEEVVDPFAKAEEITQNVTTEEPVEEEQNNTLVEPDAEDFELEEVKDVDSFDYELSPEHNGCVFTIKEARYTIPKQRNAKGEKIMPILAKNDDGEPIPETEHYPARVEIFFEEGNYRMSAPARWYLKYDEATNKTKLVAWCKTGLSDDDMSKPNIAVMGKAHYLFCKTFGYDIKLGRKSFLDGMKGKKCILKNQAWSFKNKSGKKIIIDGFQK